MEDSAGDRRSTPSNVADERGNPFVTFSRLVDQHISSFFRTFTDVPSSFARSGSDRYETAEQQRRWREAREEAEEFERSFNKLFASHRENVREKSERPCDDRLIPRLQEDPFDRAEERMTSWQLRNLQEHIRQEGRDLHEEYEEADRVMDCIQSRLCELCPCEDHKDQELRCPYRPADEDLDGNDRNSFIGFILPSLGWACPKSNSAKYVDESPYSPVNLEDQDPFREHRAEWRKAFEDLLLVSHGKDLSENASLDGATDKWDWINSLAKRNLIGYDPLGMKMIPADQTDQCATRQPENDASEGAPTELDFYERSLGSQSSRATSGSSRQTFASRTKTPTDSDKPSLISTLTNTERRTLPDGSIYTQVVLKKRFSDGREESTETEHTTHGKQPPAPTKQQVQPPEPTFSASTPSLGHDGKIKQALGQKIEEQKKRAWFWS